MSIGAHSTTSGPIITADGGSSGTERKMTVTNDGKVGIGISNPSELLEVTGNIKSTELIVNGDAFFCSPILKVDSSNNRVGVGTAYPEKDLDVAGVMQGEEIKITSDPSGDPVENTMYKASIIKAWVNFNGISGGTKNNSFNVDGITDNAEGDFTVTWEISFANSGYAITGAVEGTGDVSFNTSTAPTTSAVRIYSANGSGTPTDYGNTTLIVIGDQ